MPPCRGAVHLRRATEDDAPALARIEARAMRAAFADVFPGRIPELTGVADHERAWRRELAMLPEALRPSVADIDGRPVGFIAATPSEAARSAGTPESVELTVFVDPDCWAQGIARRLVEHEIRLLRRIGRADMSTWIVVGDARARAFCEALGWRPDGTRRTRPLGAASAEEERYRAPSA
ncbi:MAG: GNAT family N-acetyltransferase [Candidatus Limnocylindrales bacterium]